MGANQTKFAISDAETLFANNYEAGKLPRSSAPSRKVLSSAQRRDPDAKYVQNSADLVFNGINASSRAGVKDFRAQTKPVHREIPGCVCPSDLVQPKHRCGSAIAASSPAFGQPRNSYDSDKTLVNESAAPMKRSNSIKSAFGKLKRSLSKLGSKKARRSNKPAKSNSLRKGTLRQSNVVLVDVDSIASRRRVRPSVAAEVYQNRATSFNNDSRSSITATSITGSTRSLFTFGSMTSSTRSSIKTASISRSKSSSVRELFDEGLPQPSQPWAATDSPATDAEYPGDVEALTARLCGSLRSNDSIRAPKTSTPVATAPATGSTQSKSQKKKRVSPHASDDLINNGFTVYDLIALGERHDPKQAADAAIAAHVIATDVEAVATATGVTTVAIIAPANKSDSNVSTASSSFEVLPTGLPEPLDTSAYDCGDIGSSYSLAYLPIPENFGLTPEQAVEGRNAPAAAPAPLPVSTPIPAPAPVATVTVEAPQKTVNKVSTKTSLSRKPSNKTSNAAVSAARAAVSACPTRKNSIERPAAVQPTPTRKNSIERTTPTAAKTCPTRRNSIERTADAAVAARNRVLKNRSKMPSPLGLPAPFASNETLYMQERWAEIKAIMDAPYDDEEEVEVEQPKVEQTVAKTVDIPNATVSVRKPRGSTTIPPAFIMQPIEKK